MYNLHQVSVGGAGQIDFEQAPCICTQYQRPWTVVRPRADLRRRLGRRASHSRLPAGTLYARVVLVRHYHKYEHRVVLNTPKVMDLFQPQIIKMTR
ncbi:unnamed protein product, partial [Brenthis ino]